MAAVMELDGHAVEILELPEYCEREGISRSAGYWRCKTGRVYAEQHLHRWLVFLPKHQVAIPQSARDREQQASCAESR